VSSKSTHPPVVTHFEIAKADLTDERPASTRLPLKFEIPIPGHIFGLSHDVDHEIKFVAQETWPPEYLPGRSVRIKMKGETIDALILRRERDEIVIRGRFA
jgi:hypothetical protein